MDSFENQSESSRGGIVTARGTGDGLVLRLDSRVDHPSLVTAVSDFMSTRKSFLSGNNVSLEWVGGKPDPLLLDQVSKLLREEFSISIRDSRQKERREGLSANIELIEEDLGLGMTMGSFDAESKSSPGLFSGIAGMAAETSSISAVPVKKEKRSDPLQNMAWDDADARIVYATLRSGQKIETEHSLIVVGDVNPGGELVAGGDIVVLGSLRGTAHAGAYDETGGGRVIVGLNLQPTQLRIGMVISRGCSSPSKVPEVARVEGDIIVVEPFNNKMPCFNRGN